VEFLLYLLMSRGIGCPCPKYVLGFGQQLFLPVLDLIGMDIKLLHQLRQRSVPPNGRQRDFGLKGGGMIPSGSSCHLLLLSL